MSHLRKMFFCLLFCGISGINAQAISGTIIFDDGYSQPQHFTKLISINADLNNENGYNLDWKHNSLQVRYSNTDRFLPFENIKKIKILSGTPVLGVGLKNANIEVTTTTNITFTYQSKRFWYIEVMIADELTGQMQKVEYAFNKISVKEIKFDN